MLLRAIELKRFNRNQAPSLRSGHLAIRYGVYFDESNPLYGNTVLRRDREEGRAIRLWLRRNVCGKYAIQTSYVFFEDEADAVLCYMAHR